MLVEVDSKQYRYLLSYDPNPFISEKFINQNISKVDRIVNLVMNEKKSAFGLVAGIENDTLLSPFSAPFGGFHFRNERHYASDVDKFVESLITYLKYNRYSIKISFPPDIYHSSMNAKFINSFYRRGIISRTPDITNWINLGDFIGEYTYTDARTYYRQAQKKNLKFKLLSTIKEKIQAYEIIKENRAKMNRPIYMSLVNILSMEAHWDVDFFAVHSDDNEMVASSVFYRYHPQIVYAVFWGDSNKGRGLRAMDYLLLNLWQYYQNLGYKFIDLGISTENGIPNSGLLRFKETHDCTSSLKYKFIIDKNDL